MAISFKGAKNYKRKSGFSSKDAIKTPIPSAVHFYPLMQGNYLTPALVTEGDRVLCGQKIADLNAFAANPILSSVSGTVISAEKDLITVENDMEYNSDIFTPPAKKADELTSREIMWLLREGCVYEEKYLTPLHVILSEKKVRDCIIVCCFDSDPYISSPQAASFGNADKIYNSLKTVMRVSGIGRAYVAVDTDSKKTFADFKYFLRFNNDITPCLLKTRYPQSRDDILIKTVTGKEYTNALILSPETLCNMYDVLETGVKVTKKIVTVSGDDILESNNFAVPLGASVSSLLESGGYISPETVIAGGVIDGKVITDLDEPVRQSFKGLVAFNSKKNIPPYRKNPI